LAAPSYSKIDPESVVALWLFDEGAGDKIEDLSGNDNEGDILGAEWVKGKFGNALEFDGTDDYVEVPHNDNLNITDDLTIVAWVRPSGSNAVNYAAIVQRQEASKHGLDTYFFGFNASYRLHFGTQGENTQSAETTWKDGQWYHVAVVYKAAGFEGPLYINGEEAKLSVDNAGVMAGGTNELYMGRFNEVYLNGALDEIAIFNTALTEDDIKNIMNLGLGSVTGLAAVSSKGKLAITWGEIKR
jgi:hypothetical protein